MNNRAFDGNKVGRILRQKFITKEQLVAAVQSVGLAFSMSTFSPMLSTGKLPKRDCNLILEEIAHILECTVEDLLTQKITDATDAAKISA